MKRDNTIIRPLYREEWAKAYPLIRELRTRLLESEFLEFLSKQTLQGYVLTGAFLNDVIVGLVGYRSVSTLARGTHLHIDDLVVSPTCRGQGIGEKLMDFAEAFGNSFYKPMFLDSRPEVIKFYEKRGYKPHAATLMRKVNE
jgi:ribosomal protein S18 acetylase RimI-like enzyme